MRVETDPLRILILSSYSRGAPPDLPDLFGSGLLVRSDLKRAILLDSKERRRRGVEVSLSSYLELLELYPHDEDLWATVIDQALSHLVLDIGIGVDSAIAIVERSAPDRSELVRQTALLNDEIYEASLHNPSDNGFPFLSLPLSIGAPNFDGHPRYELRELLGRGVQGAVYAAVDCIMSEPGLTAMVAIKIIPIDDENENLSKWLDEARAARLVNHPNVVTPLDAGTFVEHDHTYLYIAYELIDGKTLDRWETPSQDQPSVRKAVRLVETIARAVAEAHASGVVHRDIKPNNIILTRQGQPMLTDFGLAARQIHADKDQSEYSGRGSLGFKPPEQFGGREGGRSPSVDVYALGGLLAWMITGRPPNGDSLAEAIEFLEHPSIFPRRAIAADLKKHTKRALVKVILRALDPDRNRRCRTVQQFADDLAAWLEHRPIPWVHRSWTARASIHLKRRPIISSAIAIGLFAIGASLVWGGQQSAAKELAVLEEHNAGQEALIEEVKKSFLLVKAVILSHQSGEPSPDWLPMITMLESLMGPLVFTTDDSGDPIWDDRIEIVQKVLDEQRAKNQPLDFETTLWLISQGFWKYNAGMYEESLDDLREGDLWLTERFGADDPMTRMVRIIEAIAQAKLDPLQAPHASAMIQQSQLHDLPRWVRDEIEEFQISQ